MAQAVHGLSTELWAFWVVGLVLAITIGKSEVATLSGLPWWHRWLGGIIAMAFFASHLWPLSGR